MPKAHCSSLIYALAEQEITSAHKPYLADSHCLGYLNSLPTEAVHQWWGLCFTLSILFQINGVDGRQAAWIAYMACVRC